MLYKSLHFKLVLIFVVFIVLVMSIVGVVILNMVFEFYAEDFINVISGTLNEELLEELRGVMVGQDFYEEQKEILRAHHGNLGINAYRNLYILDIIGLYRAGTTEEIDANLIRTPNILEAIKNKSTAGLQSFYSDYMDYAIYLSNTENECIIYIIDSKDQLRRFSWEILSIIIIALLLGLLAAVILSFFLAKAITSPIQSITRAAHTLAEGDFNRKIKIISKDEIGTLAETFNDMAEKLESTLDEVSSEREKLEIIFLYLKDGVLVFTSGGVLLRMNPEAEEFLDGFGIQNNLNELLELLNIDMPKIAGKNADIYRDVAYGDRIFDVNISGFKYMDVNREVMGTIVVLQDITQRYALEKSRREFIANVSHELAHPLSSISGSVQSILERENMIEETKMRYLNIILSESERMTRILKDLLVVSRIDNKKMMWKFVTVNPEIMVKNIYELMRGSAEKKEQKIRLNIIGESPFIFADKERIEMVLINVISNAIKYTQEGGSIEFILSPHEIRDKFSGIRFIIKDNGYGIPREDLPHIFERFYRVDKSRSTEAGGTGLGLAIAQEIVLAHNGTIKLDSDPDKGTIVIITLPCDNGEGDKDAE